MCLLIIYFTIYIFMTMIKINDPIIENISSQIESPEIISTNNIFHDLVSCIIEQQIHYRSSKNIFKRALERANLEILTLDNFHLFEEFGLSKLKISTNKQETILRVIDYWSNCTIDFSKLSDEEVVAELSKIKGIGKWTIDMILLYTLGRENVFPYDDFQLKQIMVSLYNLNPNVKLKSQMLEIASHWGNQKSTAVLYLLEWKKQKKIL